MCPIAETYVAMACLPGTMATITGLFGLLPRELILELTDLLPIVDVISLKHATHGSIQILETRISPSEYLKRTGPFTNTGDLMDVMAKHGAVLSGSRALAYLFQEQLRPLIGTFMFLLFQLR